MSFISVRNSYKKASKLLAMIAHNSREYKIDYLIKNQIKDFNNFKQKLINQNIDLINYLQENQENEIILENEIINIDNLLSENQDLKSRFKNYEDFPDHLKLENYEHNDLKTEFDSYYEIMKDIQKNNGGHTKKEGNHLIEQVISLSNEEAEKLLQQPDGRNKIIKRFKELHEQMGKKLGIKPLNFTLHLDEGHFDKNEDFKLNIHAHLTYLNFDFEKEKALWCNLKKSDFSETQDLAGNIFKDIGFQRGVKKDVSNSEHLNRDEFIRNKQNSTLLKITETEIKIKELEEDIELYKKEKEKITADLNLTNEEKKREHKKIQEDIKKIRIERKALITSKKKFDKKITKTVNDIFSNNKSFGMYNYTKIQEDIIEAFKLEAKIEPQLEEIEKFKKLLEEANKTIKNFEELTEDLKNEVKEVKEDSEIKIKNIKEEVSMDAYKNTLKKEELQKQEQTLIDMKSKVKSKGLEIIRKDKFLNKNIPKLRKTLATNRKQEKTIKEQNEIIKAIETRKGMRKN